MRGLQHCTNHGGDLKAPQGGQGLQRQYRALVACQHIPQHSGFALHSSRVQAGTRTGAQVDVQASQARQKQGCS